ncbi:MAG: LamG domain-containing protein [Kiritimatiellae bacterium]|nr:LamG domain-containing protein [Kiritimatiellia bacterium]
MKKLLILTCAAVAAAACNANDVFSDAKSWHQGFVDANADGVMNIGKTEFPESLLLADRNNAAHNVTIGTLWSSAVSGVHTSVVLRTENVVNPYTKVNWSGTVAYLPQDVATEGATLKYWSAGVHPASPFTVDLTKECTFFIRFKWSGESPAGNDKPNYILGAGDSSVYGFVVSVMSNGCYNTYSGGIWDKTWNGASDARVKPNEWTDFAVTVNNRKLTIYSYQESSEDIATFEVTGNAAARTGTPNGNVMLGISTDGACGYGWSTTAGRLRAFRGSIQSYAAWERALSADEVRQVFAWPGADLVRLGMANDSAQEFAGGAAPTTFSFDVAAKDAGLAQVLRVAATSASAAGSLSVSLNGSTIGAFVVTPGKTALFPVRKNLTVAGANTITLTRTSAEPVTIDAIALGGGIRIGNANGSLNDLAPETYGGKVFADVKTLHRGAIPYHGDNWAFNVTSGNAEFPESLDGNAASKAHLVAYNSPAEGANRYFGVSNGHTGIVVRAENVVYPYAKRTENTRTLYFPQDSVAKAGGKYDYWTCGLHLNTNNVPFIPKFDTANDACTFFMRFRWDGTVPIPGQVSYFLGTGDTTDGTYGFSVGLDENGRINFYSPKPNLSKTWDGEDDATITPNKWTDFAITLSDREVTIYTYQEDSSSVAVMGAAASGESPSSYAACNSFVIGHNRTGLCGGEWSGGQIRAYGFRGSIHAFAAWERALDADEVRQVFAWPGEPTIVDLGIVNGSNAEFGGTGTASWSGFTAHRVSGAVDWFNVRGTFTATMNRLGISNIPMAADDFATGLALRFTTTAASDACSFKVFVNNTEAGTLANVPGGTATLPLDKSLFIVGNNSVEVRFVSSSGTVYTDAIQLVRTQNGDYYTTDSDQTDCAFGHYEIENGVEKRRPTSIHVEVPDTIAGRGNYYARVLVRFKGGVAAQTLSLTLNGAAEPFATFAAQSSDAFQEFKAEIPATMLRAGDNVLTLSNAATGGGTAYLGVDYVRIETCFRGGMTIIVR